jgi:tetratricopeptide (TPR) repeat protein
METLMSRHFALVLAALVMFNGGSIAQESRPGDQALAKKDWLAAEQYFREALATNPKDGRSWYQLGTALHGEQKYADAGSAFEKARANGYAAPRALFHEAVEYAQLGDKDKAFDVLGSLNKLGFTNVSALQSDPGFAPLRSESRWQAVVETAQNNATPCESTAENRQFDFWVGAWDVQTMDGQHAGDSKIQRILNGCALLENWEGSGPGKSINSYNTARKQWQQLWVDAGGEVHEYAGGLVNGEMILEGPAADHDGNKSFRRMTFSRLSGGRVKQKGEISPDGRVWSAEYELVYVPKPAATSTSSSN